MTGRTPDFGHHQFDLPFHTFWFPSLKMVGRLSRLGNFGLRIFERSRHLAGLKSFHSSELSGLQIPVDTSEN